MVPGVWVSVGRSLDRTFVSRMFVSRLYAISGGWLQKTPGFQNDAPNTECRGVVQET